MNEEDQYEDQYMEHYIAEDGTPMVQIYTWNNEAGEFDYVGSMPEHWGPHEDDY